MNQNPFYKDDRSKIEIRRKVIEVLGVICYVLLEHGHPRALFRQACVLVKRCNNS